MNKQSLLNTSKKKIIFWIIWLGLISIGPITVLSNTPFSVVLANKALLANFFQRIFGLMAFMMILIQIILGSFMSEWIEKLGGWVLRFHIMEGILVYSLVIAHPLSFVVFNYFIKGALDPFYVFVDVCILCKNNIEVYYNLGRITFWLITTAVFAALFRTQNPFIRLHWRAFHQLNYIAFFFMWYHSFKLGTDIGTFPFSIIHGPSLFIISGILVFKGWRLYQTSISKAS